MALVHWSVVKRAERSVAAMVMVLERWSDSHWGAAMAVWSALVTVEGKAAAKAQDLGQAMERWSDSHWGAAMAAESEQATARWSAMERAPESVRGLAVALVHWLVVKRAAKRAAAMVMVWVRLSVQVTAAALNGLRWMCGKRSFQCKQ